MDELLSGPIADKYGYMSVAAPPTNALLDSLEPLRMLEGSLEEVHAGQVLLLPGAAGAHAYFPITAALSLISTMVNGDSCEIALVGSEGMVGLAGVLGAHDNSTSCVVQVGGACWRISANAVSAARQRNTAVRDRLDRYTTARLIQVARLAACNRLHHIGSRLARWLLMLHDRIGRDHLRLSQQSIANSLGVRRPTIALELQRLHHTGAIVYRSRVVKIADRMRLESLACECHQSLHRDYLEMVHAQEQPVMSDPLYDSAGLEGSTVDLQRERDLLAVASHELCARLQTILGWCALAKLPNAPTSALDVIERNARAQLPLIKDLMDSPRMHAGTPWGRHE
jgi:CRP-like cAMP-binding protein